MLSENTIIYIDNNNVSVSTLVNAKSSYDGDVEVKFKQMSLQAFINAVKSIEMNMATPIFSSSTIRYKEYCNKVHLLLFSPPCHVDVRASVYDEDWNENEIKTFEKVPFPAFIMSAIFLENGSYSSSTVRALKNTYTTVDIHEDMPSYFMPFPNVFGESRVCWGDTMRNVNINLNNADLLLNLFKGSVFNDDLFDLSNSKIREINPSLRDLYSYLSYLSGMDEFPENFLLKERPLNEFI